MTDAQDALVQDTLAKIALPELPKRFYKAVDVAEQADGFLVRLDGRAAKTPGKKPFLVPDEGFAQAVAAEWAAQQDTIKASSMPHTRLLNAAIDGVLTQQDAVRAEVLKYAGSDLVCYRAQEPEGLRAVQAQHWDPVVDFVQQRYGAQLQVASGVMYVAQPPVALEKLAQVLAGFSGFRVAALHSMTSLTGSVFLALGVCERAFTVEAAWQAAHADEDWTIAHWGEDEEARVRRDLRLIEFRVAARMAAFA